MKVVDSLGDRMKRYENINRYYLIPRMPVVIRVDGRAFHTYTQNFKKPFDDTLIDTMIFSAKSLADGIQNFQIGYVQSDEASFVMNNIADFDSQPWFDNNLQKIVSVCASAFTAYFNIRIMQWQSYTPYSAQFDCRVFNLPQEEIANYLLWRSKDWSRNSLNMFARSIFSHKELEGKSTADVHDMLHTQNINWLTAANDKERNGTLLVRTAGGVIPESPDHEIIQREIQYMYDDVIKLQQTKKEI